MDGQRFDNLARKCAASSSRRGFLRALAGGAFGLVAARVSVELGDESASAQDACTRSGEACADDGECCATMVCRQGACRQGCHIDGSFRTTGSRNPDNACLACRPGVSTTAWSPVRNGTTCNDGDPCTKNDVCKAGVCTGTPKCGQCKSCDPTTGNCTPVPEPHPCDDGNACTVLDYCAEGVCQPGTRLTCIPRSCHQVKCNPATGECEYRPLGDGTACSAEPVDACHTAKGTCSSGVCVQREKRCGTCKTCDPAVGCVPVENETPCDNGTYCDGPDHCIDGECVPTGEGVGVINWWPPENVCQTGFRCDERKNKVVPTYEEKGTPCELYPPPPDPACHYNKRCTGNRRCISDYNPCDPVELGLGPCQQASCDGNGGCIIEQKPFLSPCVSDDPCLVDTFCHAPIEGMELTCLGREYICDTGCNVYQLGDHGLGAKYYMTVPDGTDCSTSNTSCFTSGQCYGGRCNGRRRSNGTKCGGDDCFRMTCQDGMCIQDGEPREGKDCSSDGDCCPGQVCTCGSRSECYAGIYKCKNP